MIGLGYVGLPVAAAFARSGAPVIGFDIDDRRISELRRGFDRTREIDAGGLDRPGLLFTSDPRHLERADFFIVPCRPPSTMPSVPTSRRSPRPREPWAPC